MAYPVVGSGLDAQLLAVAESTYGIAPSLSGARGYEFKSETLAMKKNTVQGEGLAAGRLYDRTKRRVLTTYDVAGNIVMDCPTRQLAFWLQYMVGSFGQSGASPTEIGSTGIFQSYHQGIGGIQTTGGLLGHSLTIQKGVPDVSGDVYPFTYVGCKISDWELKVAVNAIAELTLSFDGRNELAGSGNGDPLNASVPSLEAWPGVPTSGLGEGLFHFKEATLYTGGTPTNTAGFISLAGEATAGNITDIDIKHTVKFDNSRFFLGTSGFKAEQIENGFRALSGTFTIEWLNGESYYNAFSADTTTSLELKFTGPSVSSSNYLLDILIPNIKLDGSSPMIPGPGVVTQSVPFTGLDDETTVPIQITYQSEDTSI